jgi:carotenoid cleavage dioxygenase-like enzyme
LQEGVLADDAVGLRSDGNFAPIAIESDLADLSVKGELPRALEGTLFRNGPNPQFPGSTAHSHWFTGDGMLHAFTLQNGKASYRNRWVRTPRWRAEHAAGRALFGGFGPKPRELADIDSGVANTHVVWHAGRLLALEEAHRPMEVDPVTLSTRGYVDLGGAARGPFTAHPKIDPATGEMIFFGYGAPAPLSAGMTFGIIDAAGDIKRFDRFEAPYASMVHDFVVTDRHVLFPILPLTGSMERARAGRPPFAWEPDKGAWVGVMKRDGATADMTWFRGESCYVFHVMNACEKGDKIFADVMQIAEPPLFPHADGTPADPAKTKARLCRWTFDLSGATDRFDQAFLDDLDGEFPRIDDRRAGLDYRHGWFACNLPQHRETRTFGSVAHLDHATGKRNLYALPPGDAVSEPVFVADEERTGEGVGWLLATVWRAAENRSDLIVLDAQGVEAGPIATVSLPDRVPFGFHGNWLSASERRLSEAQGEAR